MPFAERAAVAEPGLLFQARHDARLQRTPVLAAGQPDLLEEFALLGRRQRGQVGPAGGGRGDGHARAHVDARGDQRTARPERIDDQHVELVAHAHVHAGAGELGQCREMRPCHAAQVEVAQVAVAHVQERRPEAESFAVGRLPQVAAGHQRCRQARHGRLGNAGGVGQFAVAQRSGRLADRLQHGQAPRQGAHLRSAARFSHGIRSFSKQRFIFLVDYAIQAILFRNIVPLNRRDMRQHPPFDPSPAAHGRRPGSPPASASPSPRQRRSFPKARSRSSCPSRPAGRPTPSGG